MVIEEINTGLIIKIYRDDPNTCQWGVFQRLLDRIGFSYQIEQFEDRTEFNIYMPD